MGKDGVTILLVEDEPGLVITLTDRLTSEGYNVLHAGDGIAGEKLALTHRPHLLLLDLMLPRKGGFDVCRDLRNQGFTSPILMLTARGQVNEKVVGLKLGADDYVTKPFDMMELLARIESLLRRPHTMLSTGMGVQSYTFDSVSVDFRTMEVTREGKKLELSGKEFQLLRHFIEHRGTALSRESILNSVWGYESYPSTRTIDTHITWLRQKLEENPHYPKHFITIHGVGYKFVD
jgi:two-component system, OmpR family, alkaline phosphatase synthesis response regulator PhoP